jgi:hypothetical protein
MPTEVRAKRLEENQIIMSGERTRYRVTAVNLYTPAPATNTFGRAAKGTVWITVQKVSGGDKGKSTWVLYENDRVLVV